MILAQCNAVISLVDEKYHERAWCSVEVMMVQTLKKSYNIHLWYEHVHVEQQSSADEKREVDNGDSAVVGEKWILRPGPMNLDIVMQGKKLTFEQDRPKVLFLERQSKLLG